VAGVDAAESRYRCKYSTCPFVLYALFPRETVNQLVQLMDSLPHTGLGTELQPEDIPVAYTVHSHCPAEDTFLTRGELSAFLHLQPRKIQRSLRRLHALDYVEIVKSYVFPRPQLHAFFRCVLDEHNNGGEEK